MVREIITCGARDCQLPLPADANSRRRYCTQTCRRREADHRRRDREAGEDGEVVFHNEVIDLDERRLQRGPKYNMFVRRGMPEAILTGKMDEHEAAARINSSPDNVRRWLDTFRVDHAGETASWAEDGDRLRVVTGELADFRRKFFPKMLMPKFHQEWADAIDEVVGTGDQLLLMAPQRFGKTEMLIHYCIKRIVEDPNVRIGWVSKTQDLAEKSTGFIRQVLTHNQLLLEQLPAGVQFQPEYKSGLSWTDREFTVATRSIIDKSPTMTAIGVGGTIVGRDFDLLILDDPQDRKRCMSPTKRQDDIEWFLTDFASRKEEHTGVAFIMSRQHEDDLPGEIIRNHVHDWKTKVYQAHDPACTLDEKDYELHWECALWPQKRSFEWLMGRKRANPEHFERNYMNNPQSDMMTYLSAANLEDRRDPAYTTGMNPGGRLIAGIDPASSKPTAGVLWAYHDRKRYLVDSFMASPGTRGVREIIRRFRATYGCSRFIVEKNGYQGQVMQDRELVQMCQNMGVQVKSHYTSRVNKWDDGAGVVAMLHRIANPDGDVVLPSKGGDRDIDDRLELLYRQWMIFDPDLASSKHADDDLVMASWFPHLEMDRWDRQIATKVVHSGSRTGYGTPYSAMTRRGA